MTNTPLSLQRALVRGIIEHVSEDSSVQMGILVNESKSFSEADAKAIDPGAFKKKGGWFVGLDFAEDQEDETLYVYRSVSSESAEDLISWAREQGFPSTIAPDDMHVTVAFSREPLDWQKAPPNESPLTVRGGARKIKKFGDAVVLCVPNSRLQMDFSRYRKAGASFDHDKYTPHITITYQSGDVDLSKVTPFSGDISLNAESQEPVKEGAGEDIPEVSTEVKK